MVERISISDVSKKLGFRDPRSVENWCRENNIEIDQVGKRKYIYKIEFEAASNKNLIEDLLKKYGERWYEMYEAYMEGDIRTFLELKERLLERKPKRNDMSEDILKEDGKRFLQEIKEIINVTKAGNV